MHTRRFAFVPAIAMILKVLAIIMVVLFIYQYVFDKEGFIDVLRNAAKGKMTSGMDIPAYVTKSERFFMIMGPVVKLISGLFLPLIAWLLADLVLAARELEYQLRLRNAGAQEPKALDAKEPAVTA